MNSLRKKEINIKKRGVKTPLFMPDATRGLVKTLSNEDLKKSGIEAVVVNTFHLYLNPGTEIIKKSDKTKRNYKKGIHNFMDWDGLVLSDSGGFQVFSLIHKNPKMGRIYEDKVEFMSPWDGSRHRLTPEKSIQIQFDLGVDMMVCLDDCPPNNYNKQEIKESITRTLNWAERCKEEHERQIKLRKIIKKERPLLFSVVQGGGFSDLREKCTKELVNIGFDGYGFGARPVDDEGNFLSKVLEETANNIPENAWRFALGIGLPEDIIRCAKMGWDIFDCVIPTREGRHGKLFQFKNIEK
ncbi:tRNA-guanine transglycosylase, partial [bacterium]|nr:tRNA-guanine transglycosylase [bacterium]